MSPLLIALEPHEFAILRLRVIRRDRYRCAIIDPATHTRCGVPGTRVAATDAGFVCACKQHADDG